MGGGLSGVFCYLPDRPVQRCTIFGRIEGGIQTSTGRRSSNLASFYLAHFFLPVVRENILEAAVDSGRFVVADRESVEATVRRLLDDSFGPFLRNGSRRPMIGKPTGFMKITVPLSAGF